MSSQRFQLVQDMYVIFVLVKYSKPSFLKLRSFYDLYSEKNINYWFRFFEIKYKHPKQISVMYEIEFFQNEKLNVMEKSRFE